MDTGAEANCIDVTEVKRLKLTMKPTTQSAKAADGVTVLNVLGEISTIFERSGHSFPYNGLVCANLSSSILAGIPFIKGNAITQELHKQKITFERNGKKYSILEIPPFCPKPEPSTYLRQIKCAQTITLLSDDNIGSDGSVCEFQLPNTFPPDCHYFIEAPDGNESDGLLPQVVQAVGNSIKIRNILPYPVSFNDIRVSSAIATINAPNEVFDDYSEPSAMEKPPDFTLDIFVNSKISKKQKERLRAIHAHNNKVFNSDLNEGYNGKAGNFDVDYEWVHNQRPPVNSGKCVNYHRKKEDKDVMQAMIDRLEEQNKVAKTTDLGIIPRYASPAMLVLKNKARKLKDCEYDSLPISEKLKYNRFVQCLQKLNQYVEKKPFENVDLEDTIYKVGAAKYVITGDLTDSFQQRWIAPNKQPYFCFNSPYKGTYVMLRLSQGFLNQSEELNEMLTVLLSEFVSKGWCIVFHDNLYVIGDEIDTTIERWKQVLETLNKNNLKLSEDKTFCFPDELELLGWIKQGRSLLPDPHRHNALKVTPRPETVKQLRSFLGAYRTFQKCKPKIHEILGDLQQIASNKKSSEKIEWTPELTSSFELSLKELDNLESLYLPSPDDQLIATFDYSMKGLSATLWAHVDGQHKMVSTVSGECPPRMSDWPPCDGEAASAAFGLNRPHIRDPILQSNKTTYILMDSKPVVEAANLLKRGKLSASNRMSKLLNSFSGLMLDFRHNSGKLGHNDWDDFHSRNPAKCSRPDCHTCKFLLDCASLTIGAVGVDVQGKACLLFRSATNQP